MEKKLDLTQAEWLLMEQLWTQSPQTGRELTCTMQAQTGWSRSTTLTLLRRMVGKGVVTCDTEGTKNTFSPAVRREDAALAETETFLDRVYQGSLSMMVSAMTRRQAISKEEIDELYELLRQMEEGTKCCSGSFHPAF